MYVPKVTILFYQYILSNCMLKANFTNHGLNHVLNPLTLRCYMRVYCGKLWQGLIFPGLGINVVPIGIENTDAGLFLFRDIFI